MNRTISQKYCFTEKGMRPNGCAIKAFGSHGEPATDVTHEPSQ